MAAKKPALPLNTYLLCLVAPGINGVASHYPMGLFLEPEDAVKWAVDHGIPKNPDDTTGDSDVPDNINNAGASWPDDDDGNNYKPYGYRVIEFDAFGMPNRSAEIKPYETYDPGTGYSGDNINLDQVLHFN